MSTVMGAQLGVQVSPGPLAKVHGELEGVRNCTRCHEAGRELSGAKCLTCHKDVADRIAKKTGVHRAVTEACQKCHPEHAGAEADLLHLDTRRFDHRTETGFPLEGLHAKLAETCAACHKKRTFLDTRAVCSSCHADVHQGALGADCTRCHSALAAFKEARTQFDHTRTSFVLTGGHRSVACEKCHVKGAFKGLPHDVCSACHRTPHRQTLGTTCTACHVTDQWRTRTIEHAKTGFTLVGAHVQVTCEKCHTAGVTKPLRADRCSACHTNVHRASIKDDCRPCHAETSFRGATFDHATRTPFPLTGKHEGLPCRKCHTTITADVPLARQAVDFGGVNDACAACHTDEHKGDYGPLCDGCHRPTTFKASGFVHPRAPEFFGGQHTTVTCVKCHVRATEGARPLTGIPPRGSRGTPPLMTCTACHADVHLGQVGASCDRCHSTEAAKFAPERFSHDKGPFPLTGKHRAIDCVKCHPSETATFPSGVGVAKRLQPVATDCLACHRDPHLGQVDQHCPACHATTTFAILTFTHRGLERFFGDANHGDLPCQSCHKKVTGQFPAGVGTAIRFKVGRTCADCHPF